MTTPALPPLIVPIADVALRAGLDITRPDVVDAVTAAIRDATVDAETYLGRPVTPLRVVEHGLRPNRDGSWPLSIDPVIAVESVAADLDGAGQTTGTYTVTYRAGLDARGLEYGAIRRWVTASAAYEHPLVRHLATVTAQVVRSVRADGQAVEYQVAPATSSAASGTVPPLSSMDLWRRANRRAYTRPGWPDPARSGRPWTAPLV